MRVDLCLVECKFCPVFLRFNFLFGQYLTEKFENQFDRKAEACNYKKEKTIRFATAGVAGLYGLKGLAYLVPVGKGIG